jgi:acyl carrier protein
LSTDTKGTTMLTRGDVQRIILDALTSINEERPDDERFVVGPETLLFGADAPLDSLSLVSVIVDVEQAVSDAAGTEVSLTDDRAMSQEISPFTDVGTLTDYVLSVPELA